MTETEKKAIEEIDMDVKTFEDKCQKCAFCRKVYANGGWSFWGCYHEPYRGKWVAEIKICPKTENGERHDPKRSH